VRFRFQRVSSHPRPGLGLEVFPVPGVILVIEDEPGIVDLLEAGLLACRFEVRYAFDGLTGTEKALTEPVDLVVLDMMLPGRDGLEVLAALREGKPRLPVILLTARADIDDRIAGLDAGAVDYVTKPFSVTELAARIRAQLRVAREAPQTTLAGGGIDVNLLTREVYRDGDLVRLSTTEFELLVYLMRNRGRVLARDRILRTVWGYDFDPGTNLVDVYIGYLRRKLSRGEQSIPIVTVRSVGYRFAASG
jgi:DNA-binding response OmpR family regulator